MTRIPWWRTFGAAGALSGLYIALALLCLVRWHTPHPWVRLDVFSGSYFVLKAIGSIHSTYSGREAFRSEKLRVEWWGMTSDPAAVRHTVLLMLGDLAVFFDYGHWHTMRAFEQPAIQSFGLAIYVLAKGWQMWTDAYLANYFGNKQEAAAPRLMNQGPFRYIRHPRYAGVIAGKIGFAFIFASIFGWISAVAWTVVYVWKVSVEENHMRQLLGVQYGSYARTTARLIPGIY